MWVSKGRHVARPQRLADQATEPVTSEDPDLAVAGGGPARVASDAHRSRDRRCPPYSPWWTLPPGARVVTPPDLPCTGTPTDRPPRMCAASSPPIMHVGKPAPVSTVGRETRVRDFHE